MRRECAARLTNWQCRLHPRMPARTSVNAHAGRISTIGTGRNKSAGTMSANGSFSIAAEVKVLFAMPCLFLSRIALSG